MSDDNDQGNHDSDQGPSSTATTRDLKNPYATLNLSTSATTDDIQRSYKQLSRVFHPDKQPPGPTQEHAQQIFIEFKNSHDILTDPALRLAYDTHEHRGVSYLKQSMVNHVRANNAATIGVDRRQSPWSTAKPTIYQKVSSLLEGENQFDIQVAKNILNEAIQYNQFQNKPQSSYAPTVSGNIDIKCTMLHSNFLGDGLEHMGLEVEKSNINFSVSTLLSNATATTSSIHSGLSKFRFTFGGSGVILHDGKANSSTQISLGYQPIQGIDLHIDLDIDEESNSKISLASSRVMSNRTYFTSSLSTIPKSNHLALSFSSHRSLFENTIKGASVIGISSDLNLHYGLVSFSTMFPNMPKFTAKLNLGLDKIPLKLTVSEDFSETHSGEISYGWFLGGGVDIKAISTRFITKYCKFSTGLHHSSLRGLSWLFCVERGSMSLKVPVIVNPALRVGYYLNAIYLSLLASLFDRIIGEYIGIDTLEEISSGRGVWVGRVRDDKELLLIQRRQKQEERLLERDKKRADALQQIKLMSISASKKDAFEEEKGGLVILKGTYGLDGMKVIDVTVALQFWVTNSLLHLPSTSKSSMLGFYDLRDDEVGSACHGEGIIGVWKSLKKSWQELFVTNTVDKLQDDQNRELIPTLTVRYRYKDIAYEITVFDDEELSLPSEKAIKLGGIQVR